MEYCKMCGGAASLFDYMVRTPVTLGDNVVMELVFCPFCRPAFDQIVEGMRKALRGETTHEQ